MPVPPIPRPSGLDTRIPSNRISLEKELQNSHISLQDIATAFERGVKVQDRIYRLKKYKNVFHGKHAVSFFVKKGFCSTRQDAVLLGRLLMEEFNLFEHVGGVDFELWDCPLAMYQFLPPEERKAREDLKQQIDEEQQAKEQEAEDDISTVLDALPNEGGDKKLENVDSELLAIAELFKQGIKIKHHRWRGRVFRNTFIGSQACDFLINSSLAKNRREAVHLGRRLMEELKLFDHVARDHPFSDDYLFYRLEEHCTPGQGDNKCAVSSFMGQVQDSMNSFSNLGFGKQSSRDSVSVPIQSVDPSSATDFLPLDEIAREFRKNVEIKDRRYHFSIYR